MNLGASLNTDEPDHRCDGHASKRRRLPPRNDGESFQSPSSSSSGPQKRLRREEYTAGWIAALPLEMAAARGMMDEIHGECERPDGDNNAYTLGTIAGHNCVLACLPAGIYGIVSATTVAGLMRSTFPSLKFWLMVGIGGGAPTLRTDIRLGDVVVSMPTPRYHGVVHYDHGKTVANGYFEHMGPKLNGPPSFLLMAVSKIQAEHRVQSNSSISRFISEMLQRYPDMKSKYSSPGPEQDVLFESEYEHEDENPDCTRCDHSRVIPRQNRSSESPVVHYGTIASGSQVIKHAQTRDRLSRELGILCFEMEAAGLMNNFPCLVIRGVCDYSDSHKNKVWQEHAAATAAAYAKELLHELPSAGGFDSPQESEIKQRRKQEHAAATAAVYAKELLHELPSAGGFDSPQESELKQRRKCCIESLYFGQIHARHDNIKAAHSKTCEWLLKSESYKLWLDPSKYPEHNGFIWIRGKPGTGKSTLMKYALKHAEEASPHDSTTVISFFFNARGAELERSTVGMYRSLLFELLLNVPSTQRAIDRVRYEPVLGMQEIDWSVFKLQDLFRRAIEMLDQNVICFIDALDECPESEIRDMVDFLSDLNADGTEGLLRVCLSSRHYPHISLGRGLGLVLEDQKGHTHDLLAYLNSRFLAIEKESSSINSLKQEILEKASGIFLWLVFAVDELRKTYDRNGMTGLRRRLHELPMGLNELFRDMLTRDREHLEDMIVCIQWILYAKQPLSPEQLYCAIRSLDKNEDLWNAFPENSGVIRKFILVSSKGLAEITPATWAGGVVQFIHESVRDFLLKDGGMQDLLSRLPIPHFQTGHELLKQCCFNFIQTWNPSPVGVVYSPDIHNWQSSRRLFSFLAYASACILHHADQAQYEKSSQATFLKGFPWAYWIMIFNKYVHDGEQHFTQNATPMYIFAELDLPNLIQVGLIEGMPFHVRGEYCRYPILASLFKGNVRSTKEFLKLIPENPWYRTQIREFLQCSTSHPNQDLLIHEMRPLIAYLVLSQHNSTLELLLETGLADTDVRGNGGETPLHIAAIEKNWNAVSILVKAGFDPNSSSPLQMTPLHEAAKAGNAEIVFLLLGAMADPNLSDCFGETSLHGAVKARNTRVVLLLLNAKADPDLSNCLGETPLMVAASLGLPEIIELLVANGAHVDLVDEKGQTALMKAASRFSIDIEMMKLDPAPGTSNSTARFEKTLEAICYLIVNGASPNMTDKRGGTPLLKVIRLNWGDFRNCPAFIETIRLLANGTDIHKCESSGESPLLCALKLNAPAIIQALLGETWGENRFLWADDVITMAVNAGPNLIRLCLRYGLTAASHGSDGLAFISKAIISRNVSALQILLEKGADVNAADDHGDMPLHVSAGELSVGITSFLLKYGKADPNPRDSQGRTPLLVACKVAREKYPNSDRDLRSVVGVLLECGADPTATGVDGKTAVELYPYGLSQLGRL